MSYSINFAENKQRFHFKINRNKIARSDIRQDSILKQIFQKKIVQNLFQAIWLVLSIKCFNQSEWVGQVWCHFLLENNFLGFGPELGSWSTSAGLWSMIGNNKCSNCRKSTRQQDQGFINIHNHNRLLLLLLSLCFRHLKFEGQQQNSMAWSPLAADLIKHQRA